MACSPPQPTAGFRSMSRAPAGSGQSLAAKCILMYPSLKLQLPMKIEIKRIKNSKNKLSKQNMWLGGCWTCDQQVTSSNPCLPLSSATLGKLSTHVPQSPSSIIWYQPMGGDTLRLGR